MRSPDRRAAARHADGPDDAGVRAGARPTKTTSI
jgi:hypothetical protein